MHYLVSLIVEAEDKEAALSEARTIADNLIEWQEFDWYNESPEDSRWENCWNPIPTASDEAKAILKDAVAGQFEEFKRHLEVIRIMLGGYTDEQIFNEEFTRDPDGPYLSRYHFSAASGVHANACQLFGPGGEHIASQRDLNYYLEKPDNLWIVQVDFHN